jgi:hypothetical protein
MSLWFLVLKEWKTRLKYDTCEGRTNLSEHDECLDKEFIMLLTTVLLLPQKAILIWAYMVSETENTKKKIKSEKNYEWSYINLLHILLL